MCLRRVYVELAKISIIIYDNTRFKRRKKQSGL